jgi:hypothetical protein
MTSESKSRGSSEPPEGDVPPSRGVPPFVVDPSLTIVWEARDEAEDEDPDGPASIGP